MVKAVDGTLVGIDREGAFDLPTLVYQKTRCSTFADLYEQYRLLLFRFANSIASGKRFLCEPEDLVQEAFFHACQQLHKYDGSTEFDTWLGKIARNKMLSCVRSKYMKQLGLLTEDDWRSLGLTHEDDSSLVDALLDDTHGHFEKVLEQLFSGRDAQIIALRRQGHNNREIGEQIGLSRGSVGKALKRMFEMLQPHL